MYTIKICNGSAKHPDLLYTLTEDVAEETAAAVCAYMKTNVTVARGDTVLHEFFAK